MIKSTAYVLSYKDDGKLFYLTLLGDKKEVLEHADRLGLSYDGELLVSVKQDDDFVELMRTN